MAKQLIHPKGNLVAHNLALLLPPMDKAEYNDLVESVKALGQLRDDITLLDGEVLDGLNRYRACLDAGVKPTFVNYNPTIDGPSPTQFVLDKNFNRRHLTLSQRAAVATLAIPYFDAEAATRKQATQFKAKGTEAPAAATVTVGVNVISEDEAAKHDETPIVSGTAAPATPVATSAPVSTPTTAANAPQAAPAPATVPPPAGSKSAATTTTGTRKPRAANPQAELLAKIFGTSATMVGLAKRIQKDDTDLFQQVLENKITVNAAIEILDERKKAQADTATKLLEKQQRADALATLGDKYGQESEVYKAVVAKKMLKKVPDLVAFAAMKPKDTPAIVKLMAQGWDLDKAQRYLDGKITLENTVEDCINTAIARGKPNEPFPLVVGKWTLVLTLTA